MRRTAPGPSTAATPGGTRYAPLDQVNRDNVDELEIAWTWHSDSFGPEPELRGQTTPLMIDGMLYATAGGTRSVVALDAGTGELR